MESAGHLQASLPKAAAVSHRSRVQNIAVRLLAQTMDDWEAGDSSHALTAAAPSSSGPPPLEKRRSFASLLERLKMCEAELVMTRDGQRRSETALAAVRAEIAHLERLLVHKDGSLSRKQDAMEALQETLKKQQLHIQRLQSTIACAAALHEEADSTHQLQLVQDARKLHDAVRESESTKASLAALEARCLEAESRAEYLERETAAMKSETDRYVLEREHHYLRAVEDVYRAAEIREICRSFQDAEDICDYDGVDLSLMTALHLQREAHDDASPSERSTKLIRGDAVGQHSSQKPKYQALGQEGDFGSQTIIHNSLVDHLNSELSGARSRESIIAAELQATKLRLSELTAETIRWQRTYDIQSETLTQKSVQITELTNALRDREDRLAATLLLANPTGRSYSADPSRCRNASVQTSIGEATMSRWASDSQALHQTNLEWAAYQRVSEGKLAALQMKCDALQRTIHELHNAGFRSTSSASPGTATAPFRHTSVDGSRTANKEGDDDGDGVRKLQRELRKVANALAVEKQSHEAAIARIKLLEEIAAMSTSPAATAAASPSEATLSVTTPSGSTDGGTAMLRATIDELMTENAFLKHDRFVRLERYEGAPSGSADEKGSASRILNEPLQSPTPSIATTTQPAECNNTATSSLSLEEVAVHDAATKRLALLTDVTHTQTQTIERVRDWLMSLLRHHLFDTTTEPSASFPVWSDPANDSPDTSGGTEQESTIAALQRSVHDGILRLRRDLDDATVACRMWKFSCVIVATVVRQAIQHLTDTVIRSSPPSPSPAPLHLLSPMQQQRLEAVKEVMTRGSHPASTLVDLSLDEVSDTKGIMILTASHQILRALHFCGTHSLQPNTVPTAGDETFEAWSREHDADEATIEVRAQLLQFLTGAWRASRRFVGNDEGHWGASIQSDGSTTPSRRSNDTVVVDEAPYTGEGSPAAARRNDSDDTSPLNRTQLPPRPPMPAPYRHVPDDPLAALVTLRQGLESVAFVLNSRRLEASHLKQSLYDVKVAFLAEMEAREALEAAMVEGGDPSSV